VSVFITQQPSHRLREFTVTKLHSITESFLTLVGSEATEDMGLLIKVASIGLIIIIRPQTPLYVIHYKKPSCR